MTTISSNKIKFRKRELLFIVLIALYSAGFLNKAIGIVFLLLPFVVWGIISKGITVRVMLTSFFLITFSVYYAVSVYYYSYSESLTVILGFLISPIIMYWAGYVIITESNRNKMNYWLFLTMATSMVAFSLLSIYRTILIYGSLENASPMHEGRTTMSFWGENFISATGMNTYLSFGIALAPVLFFAKDRYVKNIKLFKLLILVCFLSAFSVTITLGNRTGLLILIVSTVFVFLFTTKISTKKIFRFGSIVLLGLFGAFLFTQNFFGLRDKWFSTTLGMRTISQSGLDNPRIQAWKEAFVGLFQHPFGGRETDLSIRYAHNLWLDVGYDAGIIPFMLLIIFTLLAGVSVIKFIRSGKRSILIRSLYIAGFTAIFITCFLEPIMQGWFYYFTIACLLLGVIHRNLEIDSKTQ